MAGHIYKEATEFLNVLDSTGVANRYNEGISIIANCISKLHDVVGKFEYLRDACDDNGDPSFDLDEAIKQLGVALATAVEYRDSYLEEANGNTEKDSDEA